MNLLSIISEIELKIAKFFTDLGSNVRKTSKISQNSRFEAQMLLGISDLRLDSCWRSCYDFQKCKVWQVENGVAYKSVLASQNEYLVFSKNRVTQA